MPATRGSSSSGASAVDQAGSEQQADPSIDVDPTNETICFFHNEQGMSVMDTDFESRTVGIFQDTVARTISVFFAVFSGIPAKRVSVFFAVFPVSQQNEFRYFAVFQTIAPAVCRWLGLVPSTEYGATLGYRNTRHMLYQVRSSSIEYYSIINLIDY